MATASSNDKKTVKGWNQEATDTQGRRRFHGAFTGGFSAGYFNSVGTKEGWTPTTFNSSRNGRSNYAQQRPEDFMDEEDDPLLGKSLVKDKKYDTLDERANANLNKLSQEIGKTSNIIPGPIPKDLIVPSQNSIGKKLLQLMGWKEGQGIGPKKIRKKLSTIKDKKSSYDEEDVLVAPKNTLHTSLFPTPKTNRFGHGFDPYKNAPEFRNRNLGAKDGPGQPRVMQFMDVISSSTQNTQFGLSALEEDDDINVYETDIQETYDFSTGPRETSMIKEKSFKTTSKMHDVGRDGKPPLEGFHLGKEVENIFDVQIANPIVPKDFRPQHKFQEKENTVSLYKAYNFNTSTTGRANTLTAEDRGAILGEATTKKSVFEMIPSDARKKLEEVVFNSQEKTQKISKKPKHDSSADTFREGVSTAMSNRFTTSSEKTEETKQVSGSIKPERTTQTWKPEKLLCKRFNVALPSSHNIDSEIIPQSMFQREIGAYMPFMESNDSQNHDLVYPKQEESNRVTNDSETIMLSDKPRPPTGLFKAIFENSDESENEDDNDENEDEDTNKSMEGKARMIETSLNSISSYSDTKEREIHYREESTEEKHSNDEKIVASLFLKKKISSSEDDNVDKNKHGGKEGASTASSSSEEDDRKGRKKHRRKRKSSSRDRSDRKKRKSSKKKSRKKETKRHQKKEH